MISPPRRPICARAGSNSSRVPGLDTVDGIADIGFALAAWFVDPDRNSIGLLQLKNAD
jgi:hypothetical protein